MSEDQARRNAGEGIRETARSVVGVLGALKDALEQTFEEMRGQGELSPDRAREVALAGIRRAQDAVEDVRERLDFVPRREFDALRREVAELRARLDDLAGAAAGTIEPAPDPTGGAGPGEHPHAPDQAGPTDPQAA
jgi:polyhydroxyalkanoate synthesis regulator phasin